MDNNATARTVTTTSAETVGNPNNNTREDSMSETKPETEARNHLGESYLSNARRPNSSAYL